MVVSEEKLRKAVDVLRSFGARRVLLFGSYISAPERALDLDLAVEGIPLAKLGAADVAIYRLLHTSFDLVSRDESPEFFDLIAEDAVTLYEQS